MAHTERPLSPHVGIYRWDVSNGLSILHRTTGIALSLGAFALVVWLVAVAAGPDVFATVQGLLDSIAGRLALFAWTFCFFYHLGNGVRHLFWDVGMGFDKSVARRSGWTVVAFAVLTTLGFWAAV